MSNKNKLILLFKNMFIISAFTFGGGFAIVSLMKTKFVDELHWIDENEMIDLTTISESCPGAIAVNAAILVGYKINGYLGVIISVIATILPPIIILSIISAFYIAFSNNEIVKIILTGMQAGVSAVVINVAVNLGKTILKNNILISYILTIASFIATFCFSINTIYIILVSLIIGIVISLIDKRKEATSK